MKPQFEAGRAALGKGGVVRDPALHEEICRRIDAVLPELRFAVPPTVEMVVEGWSGYTADGSNEDALLAKLDAFIANEEEEAVNAIRLRPIHYAAAIGGGLVALYSLITTIWLFVIIGIVAVAWAGYEYLQIEPRKQAVRDELELTISVGVATLEPEHDRFATVERLQIAALSATLGPSTGTLMTIGPRPRT